MKHFIFCTLLCSIISLGYPQVDTCNNLLKGSIADEHDSSPLSFSSIAVLESGLGSIADEKGKFSISGLCFGSYHFVVSHIGCEPDTVLIEIQDSIQFFHFQLEHHTELLKEVRIFANRNANTLNAEELERDRGLLFSKMLQGINGVRTLNNGQNVSKAVVHGLSGNRLKIIHGDFALENQSWGDDHSPEIDPFTVNSIRLVRGASALKYGGDAIGGVLLAQADELPKDTVIGGEVILLASDNNRMGNVAAKIEGSLAQLPAFSWRLQGSAKKSGNVKTPNYFLKNTGLEEYNFSYNMAYNIAMHNLEFAYSQFNSNIAMFSGAHIENLSDLQDALEQKRPRKEDTEGFSYEIGRPYQHVVHETAGFKYEYNLNSKNKLDLTISRQFNLREEYDKHPPKKDELAELNLPEFSVMLSSYTAHASWIKTNSKSLSEVGIQGVFKENTLAGPRDFIPEYLGSSYSSYLFRKWYLNKVDVEAAFRYDYKEKHVFQRDNTGFRENFLQFHVFNFASGVSWEMNKLWNFTFNTALAQRPPAINELYSRGLHHGTASLEYGNSNLKKEKLLDLNVGLNFSNQKLNAELYVYNKYFRDFIYLQASGVELSIRGAYPVFKWEQADANIWGIDFSASHPIVEFLNFNFQGSFLKARKFEAEKELAFMPPNRLSGEFQYIFSLFGNPTTFLLGAEEVFEQKAIPESEIMPAPPAYFLLSADASMKISLNKNEMNMGFKIENLLNNEYRDYMNRMRYFAHSMGRRIMLRLKYSF